jgi:uncharacterized protein (TIGR03790 family)
MRYTLCGIIFLAAATARADLTPTEIGIIGRAGSAESRRLAEHYAAARGVPQSQIYYGDIPAVDELPRAVWDSRVRPAIRAWLHNGGLEAKIRCLVTLRDIPLKIGRRDANDPAVKARQEFFAAARESRVKAITELIKAFQAIAPDAQPLASPPPLSAAAPLTQLTEALEVAVIDARQRLLKAPADTQRGGNRAMEQAFMAGSGLSRFVRSFDLRPERSGTPPSAVAQIQFWRGEVAGLEQGLQAVLSLPAAVERDVQALRLVQTLHGLIGAVQWIDGERQVLEKNETYASFDSELSLVYWSDYPLYRWQPNLLYYENHYGAHRPTLMVSRLAAPTMAQTLKLIDTAIAVEQTGLTGKVYLDARGIAYDPQSNRRDGYGQFDQSLRDLAARLKAHTSLQVILDDKAELFPPGSCPDAALYCGWYSLGQYIDAFTWRPGAVGYHLASMEAQTLTTPGNPVWCNAMLERGVCATLGPVYEPYIETFPLPDDFFSVLLTGRYTLAETFYRTNPFNSWVMVLVGDPLYSPFKNHPMLRESDLPERIKNASATGLPSASAKPTEGQSPKKP